MAARTGMANLIEEVRGMADAGTADYSLAGQTYFSDDDLQRFLDKTARRWKMQPLQAQPQQIGGSVVYYDYLIPSDIGQALEEAASGTAVWQMRDSVGNAIGTANYDVNYYQRVITFPANTMGSAYYLDCVSYNLQKATAEIYQWKAAHVAQEVDWQSDNHRLSASQKSAAYLKLAEHYRRQAGARVVTVGRGDLR